MSVCIYNTGWYNIQSEIFFFYHSPQRFHGDFQPLYGFAQTLFRPGIQTGN